MYEHVRAQFVQHQSSVGFVRSCVQVWGGFGIVFIAIYTAKLAAFMVEIGKIHTASNIHGIVVSNLS
jgi:hypothetical protein